MVQSGHPVSLQIAECTLPFQSSSLVRCLFERAQLFSCVSSQYGLVQSHQESVALSVQCDENVSKQQVYEASGLQLSRFQFQGLEFETVRAVTLSTLHHHKCHVTAVWSLAVLFPVSSTVSGSNLDASVSFVKASRVAVSISSPPDSSASGFLALPWVVFLSSSFGLSF